MSGRATLTTVMSNRSMKVPVHTATSVHHLRSIAPPRSDVLITVRRPWAVAAAAMYRRRDPHGNGSDLVDQA